MQDGMRIKSKDIHFEIFIFYVAMNLFIDNLFFSKLYWLEKLFTNWLLYLPSFKIERACSIPLASSWRPS